MDQNQQNNQQNTQQPTAPAAAQPQPGTTQQPAPSIPQQPTPPPPPQTPAQTPPQSAGATPPQAPLPSDKSKKKLLITLVVVALLVIFGILAYAFTTSNTNSTQELGAAKQRPKSQTQQKPTLTEEQALEAIDVGSVDADMAELEKEAALLE